MRALARAFLLVASAVWLAASSAAQTVNIYYKFTDFQLNPANVSQMTVTPWPTNGTYNGGLLHQIFPKFTRATTPSLTNGEMTLTNVIVGVVYQTTFTARGGDQTYYILADTNAPDGSTIGAWTNVVSPTNLTADGLFALSQKASDAKYLLKVGDVGSNETFVGKLSLPVNTNTQVGYVFTVTNSLTGAGDYEPSTGGGGGSATNVWFIDSTGTHWDVIGGSNRLSLSVNLTNWSQLPTNAFDTRYDLAGTALAIGLQATNYVGVVSNSIANTVSNWNSSSNAAYQAQFAPNVFSSETNNGQQSTNSFIRQEWFPEQQEGVARLPILGIGASFNPQIWMTNGVQGISNALYNASQSLYPFGYNTILLDDGWGNSNLDANGLMQLSPQMQITFGSGSIGVSNMIAAIHTQFGFKVILYIDGGTNLSSLGIQHGMGSQLLWTNASTLISYGVDGFKSIQYEGDEERLAGIIAQSSRPVYLMSSSVYATQPFGPLYPTMCNGYFSSGGTDVGPFSNVIVISDIISSNNLWRWVKPGHFLETDYIGGEIGNGGTLAAKSHVILNALISSTLFDASGFFSLSTPYNQWFTNRDILSVQQDSAVIAARKRFLTNNCDVYIKPLGTPTGPQFALGVINRGSPAETVTLNFTNLYPLFATRNDQWSAYDCVSNVWVLTNSLSFTVNVETNDSILWKLYPGNPFTQDGSIYTNLIHSTTLSAVSGVSFAKTTNSDGSYNYAATVTASGSQTPWTANEDAAGHALLNAGNIYMTNSGVATGIAISGATFDSTYGAVLNVTGTTNGTASLSAIKADTFIGTTLNAIALDAGSLVVTNSVTGSNFIGNASGLTNSGGFSLAPTNRVSAAADGLTPILPNDATKYLNGMGAFAVPAGGSSTYSATLSGTNVLANLGFGLTNHFLWNLTNANSWLDVTNFSVGAGATPARAILELHSTNASCVVITTSNLIFGSDITGISVSTNTTFVGFVGPFPGQPTNGVRVTSNVRGYAY